MQQNGTLSDFHNIYISKDSILTIQRKQQQQQQQRCMVDNWFLTNKERLINTYNTKASPIQFQFFCIINKVKCNEFVYTCLQHSPAITEVSAKSPWKISTLDHHLPVNNFTKPSLPSSKKTKTISGDPMKP